MGKNFFHMFARLMPLWVVIAGIIGFFYPAAKPYVKWMFAATMLGIGAVLALMHFSEQTALIPALFATWCVITALILAEIWAERSGEI